LLSHNFSQWVVILQSTQRFGRVQILMCAVKQGFGLSTKLNSISFSKQKQQIPSWQRVQGKSLPIIFTQQLNIKWDTVMLPQFCTSNIGSVCKIKHDRKGKQEKCHQWMKSTDQLLSWNKQFSLFPLQRGFSLASVLRLQVLEAFQNKNWWVSLDEPHTGWLRQLYPAKIEEFHTCETKKEYPWYWEKQNQSKSTYIGVWLR
jgi:hypothetical protein